ncbi:MAG: efflux transporter outer membrane subunit [Acidobacteriota bacterium]|nr:MAG: efflux transporter outer membrane subunit [Acidobacteriota bacterium]
MILSMRALVVAAAACMLATSCKVGPDYVRLEVSMPDVWNQRALEGMREGEAPLQTWWEELGDPLLVELIERAEAANLDLRQGVARIREARALRRVAGADRSPDLSATGDYTRSESSDTIGLGEVDAGDLYTAGVDATWEIDLFGRVRRSVEAATADLEASIEDYRDVLVTLFAEVALNYVDVRTLQARIELAEANVETQMETLQLTQDRFDAGLVSALDIAQAESNLASTEARIPALESSLIAARNRIAVLLGEAPGELDDELEPNRPIPDPPDEVAVGLPANLLRQRPDVRRAERDLAGQTARIGVAAADLYPRFSLSGFLGLQSASGGDFFDGDSVTWSIGLPFVSNLFTGGRVRGRIEAEKARTQQLAALYEQTILLALEEVENFVAGYALELRRREQLLLATDATKRSVELVRTQYITGLTDFQNVLDSQRSLVNQQDQLATSEGEVVKNLISLYKALGGGWTVDPEEAETLTSGSRPPAAAASR